MQFGMQNLRELRSRGEGELFAVCFGLTNMPSRQLLDFISFGGVLVGTQGMVTGITSRDIGVGEGMNTRRGDSVKLTGRMCLIPFNSRTAGDITTLQNWLTRSRNTFGQINTGLTLQDACVGGALTRTGQSCSCEGSCELCLTRQGGSECTSCPNSSEPQQDRCGDCKLRFAHGE